MPEKKIDLSAIAFILAMGLGPIIIGLGSFLSDLTPRSRPYPTVAAVLILLGALVVALNLYLSFVRPYLYNRKNSGMNGYRNVSGLPFLATAFTLLGCGFAWGDKLVASFGLLVMCIDPGGPLAFLIMTLREVTPWRRKMSDRGHR